MKNEYQSWTARIVPLPIGSRVSFWYFMVEIIFSKRQNRGFWSKSTILTFSATDFRFKKWNYRVNSLRFHWFFIFGHTIDPRPGGTASGISSIGPSMLDIWPSPGTGPAKDHSIIIHMGPCGGSKLGFLTGSLGCGFRDIERRRSVFRDRHH